MRYYDDIMNADKWNTDLNKKSEDKNPSDAPEPAIESPPHMVQSTAEKTSPLISVQEPSSKPKTAATEPLSPSRRSSCVIEMPLIKKRRPRKPKSMLLIVAGLFISILSGIVTFIWLASSGTNEISAAQESIYADAEAIPRDQESFYSDEEDSFGSNYVDAEENSTLYSSDGEYGNSDTPDDLYRGSRDEAEYVAADYADDDPFIDNAEYQYVTDEDITMPEDNEPQTESIAADPGTAGAQEDFGIKVAADTEVGAQDKSNRQNDDKGTQSDSLTAKPAQTGILVIPSPPREKKPDPSVVHEEKEVNDTPSAPPAIPRKDAPASSTTESGSAGSATRIETAAVPSAQHRGSDNAPAVSPVTATPESSKNPSPAAAERKRADKTTVISSGEQTERDVSVPGKNDRTIQIASAAPEKKMRDASLRTIQGGLSSSLKEMFVNYEEHFNTRSNNWPEYSDSTASALIDEGEYHVEHKARTGSHTVLYPYGIPAGMDFMLNVGISSVLGMGDNSYGFVFGASDRNNNYSFQIHNSRSYTVERFHNGERIKLATGLIDNIFIGGDSSQTLKIEKQGNRLRFYVNDFYITEVEETELSGDKVGFIVKGKVKISVDWTKTQIRFRNS